MSREYPISISMSRQFGSGGGILGSRLAKRLNMRYFDREIVMETAKKLGVAYQEIESFDEKPATFWQSFLQNCQYGDYTFSQAEYVPSDQTIYDAEAEIVLSAARKEPVVIVGRAANFVLEKEPNHVSIFVHADEVHRLERIQTATGMNRSDAERMIRKTDASREGYTHKFTGHNLYDLRHYNLVIDTGSLPLDKAEDLVLEYMKARFGAERIAGMMAKKGNGDV